MIFIHLELEASEADAAQHAEQVAGRRRQGVQQLHWIIWSGWQQCCGEPEWYPACAQQQGPVQGAPPRLLFVRLRPVEAVTSSDAVYSCTASPCHQSKIVQSLIYIIITARLDCYTKKELLCKQAAAVQISATAVLQKWRHHKLRKKKQQGCSGQAWSPVRLLLSNRLGCDTLSLTHSSLRYSLIAITMHSSLCGETWETSKNNQWFGLKIWSELGVKPWWFVVKFSWKCL